MPPIEIRVVLPTKEWGKKGKIIREKNRKKRKRKDRVRDSELNENFWKECRSNLESFVHHRDEEGGKIRRET